MGMLMFGMFGTLVGLRLVINPVGHRRRRADGRARPCATSARSCHRRQNEAKAAMRRYVDEVTFQVAKDSRDRLRAMQRDLRDHFTAQADQLKRSLLESQQAAERAVKASRGGAGGPAGRDRQGAGAAGAGPPAGAGAAAPTGCDQGTSGHGSRRRTGRAAGEHARRRHAAGAAAGDRRPPPRARTPPGWLHDQLRRLDEPLRVAIAGKVKAGKSTLLNALVGEQVAPTDAGECTRVVTWYRDGTTPKIALHPRDGRAAAAAGPPARRRADDRPRRRPRRASASGWWSTGRRRACASTTLIDTPGIASTSAAVSQRTVDFLDPDDDTPTEADAVVYLMRHLHARDVRVPRGVPRPRGGPGDGRQRRRGALAGRRDRRRAGRRDVLGPPHRHALPGRPDGARAVPERRRRGRAARPDRPDPAADRVHRARRAGPRGRATSWRPSCCRSTGSCGRGATRT